MTTYTIPKKDYQFLYIYEGTLLNYTLKNDEFHIIVECGLSGLSSRDPYAQLFRMGKN